MARVPAAMAARAAAARGPVGPVIAHAFQVTTSRSSAHLAFAAAE
jgi:hypothetical protein